MNRRRFVAALAALPFIGRVASRNVVALKPGESIRTPWIHLSPKRTGVGRYSAALPFPLRGDPRFVPGMVLMIGSSPDQSVQMRVSRDGMTWRAA